MEKTNHIEKFVLYNSDIEYNKIQGPTKQEVTITEKLHSSKRCCSTCYT